MQQSLNLAKEVQQNLLPKSNLKVNGFDIAGKSVYCDETGGDYYDFITIDDAAEQKIGVAIGDVSGHGIPSALLMATVRSSLRQRASLPGSTAKIISDVNRQLVCFFWLLTLHQDNSNGYEQDMIPALFMILVQIHSVSLVDRE
jgi:sigma-B regulation protein RsbU (phosphoserine phosphatase)